MSELHTQSSLSEISDYAMLCIEHGIRSVYLSVAVLDRVRAVAGPAAGSSPIIGVMFKRKKCAKPETWIRL